MVKVYAMEQFKGCQLLADNYVLVVDDSHTDERIAPYPIMRLITYFREYLSGLRKGHMFSASALSLADRLCDEYETTVDQIIVGLLDLECFADTIDYYVGAYLPNNDPKSNESLSSLAWSIQHSPDESAELSNQMALLDAKWGDDLAARFGALPSKARPGGSNGAIKCRLLRSFRDNQNFASDAKVCIVGSFNTYAVPLSPDDSSFLAAELRGVDQVVNMTNTQFVGRIEIGVAPYDSDHDMPTENADFIKDEQTHAPLSFVIHVFFTQVD